MEHDPLEIRDNDRSTHGGPPGWMAFTIIILAAVLIAIVAILIGVVL